MHSIAINSTSRFFLLFTSELTRLTREGALSTVYWNKKPVLFILVHEKLAFRM